MFASRLREQRLKYRLTMKQLGERMNLAASTISGYENGTRKPDMDTLYLFADTFNVSLDYLLGRTNDIQLPPPAVVKAPSDQTLIVSMDEMEYLKESLLVFRKYRQG
ncbi:helix-turn-helix domain-containing protein [Alkalicoccobacillus murimartini]|uniref:Transcriptional regulator with XRE-family HTH domain n=1 Tax=Alkalicoccobacillus murimartini TaxID=171685 RepID=A0ABT9YD15_9BACI|nr:helix-turn-helix transcriptional regulator [Alkalicoccobacillus murimartini]MDQ0205616.1 transcriptional regulator with XRE-family HTH domain [Alkalicoccobacillus murimartini]